MWVLVLWYSVSHLWGTCRFDGFPPIASSLILGGLVLVRVPKALMGAGGLLLHSGLPPLNGSSQNQ
jgi:hypothetical protein